MDAVLKERLMDEARWLAEAHTLLEDRGVGALEARIGEMLTDEQARRLLLSAIIVAFELRRDATTSRLAGSR